MSRASQLEQDNDHEFHQLASKVSAFKNIANEINNYAQEDSNTLGSINDQMLLLSENIKHTATKLTRIMSANPKITRMVLAGFVIFLIIYYSMSYFF